MMRHPDKINNPDFDFVWKCVKCSQSYPATRKSGSCRCGGDLRRRVIYVK